ncbi:MAG: hypothetical protein MUC56_07205 [Thermoanaerobaculales bacterium]|nr:hypothetical protein [Thermoanaerobaculales bacterium]
MARSHQSTPEDPALVLLLPDSPAGLWDPELSSMVADLEDELGVFVTWAGRGPRAMTLEDAAAAAGFMGCGSMVVVAPNGSTGPGRLAGVVIGRLADGGRLVRSEWTTPAIAAAYRAVTGAVDAAA